MPYEAYAGCGKITSTYVPPSRSPIAPLSRISPSKFHLFKDCMLRACLEQNKVPKLLPLSPAAYCGTVIHNIIKKVSNRELDEEDFDEIWDDCIENEEKQMKSSWIEMHLVPLERSIPNYELKKHQCLLAVRNISSKDSSFASRTAIQKRMLHEVWLENHDRTVGGYVDAIIPTNKGDIIVDYKTGYVAELETNAGKHEISEMYRTQLKLYAALYNSAYGSWPISLRIIGLDGSIYEIDFNQEECTYLLNNARKMLININSIITSKIGLSEIYKKLSQPAPKTCLFCLYRPICNPYWEKRNKNIATNWPKDVKGTIREKKILGNGLGLIRLNAAEGNSEIITIRGLHLERHQAFNIKSDTFAIFSVKADSVKNRYKEGLLTTIYAMD